MSEQHFVRKGERLAQAAADILGEAEAVAARRGVGLNARELLRVKVVSCAPHLQDLLAASVREANLPVRLLASGAGHDAAMFDGLWPLLEPGTRLVAHAVTLETDALLSELHRLRGGELMRVEISHAGKLGPYRSWEAERPVVQWSAVK